MPIPKTYRLSDTVVDATSNESLLRELEVSTFGPDRSTFGNFFNNLLDTLPADATEEACASKFKEFITKYEVTFNPKETDSSDSGKASEKKNFHKDHAKIANMIRNIFGCTDEFFEESLEKLTDHPAPKKLRNALETIVEYGVREHAVLNTLLNTTNEHDIEKILENNKIIKRHKEILQRYVPSYGKEKRLTVSFSSPCGCLIGQKTNSSGTAFLRTTFPFNDRTEILKWLKNINSLAIPGSTIVQIYDKERNMILNFDDEESATNGFGQAEKYLNEINDGEISGLILTFMMKPEKQSKPSERGMFTEKRDTASATTSEKPKQSDSVALVK